MTLMTDIAKKTSADFSNSFDFLTKDFGMKIYSESYSTVGGDKYVRLLRNQFVQIELAGDQNYFHCEIRRLINGETRPYSDSDNNIGFESLAVLKTNNNYNHLDFYPASVGWQNVLDNTANLLKTSKEVFTTNNWVDTAAIETLKEKEFEKKFGFKPDKTKTTFFGLIKLHGAKLLLDKGFEQTFDNSDFPPYNSESSTLKLAFEKGENKVTIAQRDWRDFYTCYFIDINGKKVFELDTAKYADTKTPADITIAELDKLTG